MKFLILAVALSACVFPEYYETLEQGLDSGTDGCSDPGLVDAPLDAVDALDAPPDAPAPSIDLMAAWPRHTIYNGFCVGTTQCNGADGFDAGDVNEDGLPDVTSGWEKSGRASLSFHPGCATVRTVSSWPTVIMPLAVNATEDSIIGDVDGDGAKDIIACGEAKRLAWFKRPSLAQLMNPAAWTSTIVTGANITQKCMKLALADMTGDGVKEIVVGGKGTPATIEYYGSGTPLVAASWVRTFVDYAGWIMSLLAFDINGDGKTDIFATDRERIWTDPVDYSKMGARWLENNGEGTSFTNHTIAMINGMNGTARFADAFPMKVLTTAVSPMLGNVVCIRSTMDLVTWTIDECIPNPSNVGEIHHAVLVDLDMDGLEDVVLAYTNADSLDGDPIEDISMVVWMKRTQTGWLRGEISGPEGIKPDNLAILDMDCDGDFDIGESEQGNAGVTLPFLRLGVFWYENLLLN